MRHTDKFTLGVYGDGQLARLLAQKAIENNITTLIYTLNQSESPCRSLCTLHEGKSWQDEENFQLFASQCETIVLENEFIPPSFLAWAESKKIKTIPNAKAYSALSNKLKQVHLARDLKIDIPHFIYVETTEQLDNIFFPAMLKSLTGGYDGHGNLLIQSVADIPQAKEFISSKGPSLLQEFIPLEKEVAIMVVSDGSRLYTFPAVETIQENNICHYVLTPPRLSADLIEQVEEAAKKIIQAIDGIGVFGVEFFIYQNRVIFNEVAPRTHNSGHFTMEACDYSQFDAQLKLLFNRPLTPPQMMTKSAGMLNLLGTRNAPASFEGDKNFLDHPQGKLHLYGKENSRVGRKMGHYTLIGDDSSQILKELAYLKNRYEI
jgi:5-(carboxyamino)imidazole ribonucleotide synthase